MKLKWTFFLMLLLQLWESSVISPLMAQKITVEGRIVDKETMLPLPFVSVFVNNTANGIVADEDGSFKLEMNEGYQELVLSLIGYENLIFSANFTDALPRYVFQMAPKLVDLNELEVKGKRSKEWYENLKVFEYHFLGNSKFALSCEIVNPEVLVIDFDQSVLKVHSTDFLIIKNHALGYQIHYLLTSFELDTNKRKFHFLGYPRYTEMEGGKLKQRRWEKNRSFAYLGSLLHFKRSVREGTTNEAGFEVRKMRLVSNPDRPSDKTIDQAKQHLKNTEDLAYSIFRDSLSAIVKKESLPKIIHKVDSVFLDEKDYSSTKEGRITLEFEDFLEITYTKGKVSMEFINSFAQGNALKSNHPISNLSISAPVIIYATDLESNPLSLLVEGYWAWQRMGDALPIDYKYPE